MLYIHYLCGMLSCWPGILIVYVYASFAVLTVGSLILPVAEVFGIFLDEACVLLTQ